MKHIFVNFVHFNTMVTPSAVIVNEKGELLPGESVEVIDPHVAK